MQRGSCTAAAPGVPSSPTQSRRAQRTAAPLPPDARVRTARPRRGRRCKSGTPRAETLCAQNRRTLRGAAPLRSPPGPPPLAALLTAAPTYCCRSRTVRGRPAMGMVTVRAWGRPWAAPPRSTASSTASPRAARIAPTAAGCFNVFIARVTAPSPAPAPASVPAPSPSPHGCSGCSRCSRGSRCCWSPRRWSCRDKGRLSAGVSVQPGPCFHPPPPRSPPPDRLPDPITSPFPKCVHPKFCALLYCTEDTVILTPRGPSKMPALTWPCSLTLSLSLFSTTAGQMCCFPVVTPVAPPASYFCPSTASFPQELTISPRPFMQTAIWVSWNMSSGSQQLSRSSHRSLPTSHPL